VNAASGTAAGETEKRLLVIDDNPEMGALVSHIARAQGYVCEYAATFSRFQALLANDPHVIVVDMIMPDTDGVEVLRYLGKQGCRSAILMLSHAEARVLTIVEEMARSLNLRVIGYLRKPFARKQLEAVLQRHENTVAPAPRAKPAAPAITVEALRQAIREHQFVVHYQPKIDIRSGAATGVEALVRWQHPGYGLVYPDAFIALAETCGCVDELTWRIVDQVFADAALFAARGWLPTLSINVSAFSLSDLNMPEKLMAKARAADIAAERIIVEITESGMVLKTDVMLDILTRLRLRDINLSIDDFGTGFSMMHQLKRIPANEIKIDKEFIRTMANDRSAEVIVRKTIEIGHELSMAVVAEGVETSGQLAALAALKCDMAQGYLFARSLTAGDILAWRAARLASSRQVGA
jgi:EAL domain-containing protein (putative c-di-GMP-specific phosphodiesterase class I)